MGRSPKGLTKQLPLNWFRSFTYLCSLGRAKKTPRERGIGSLACCGEAILLVLIPSRGHPQKGRCPLLCRYCDPPLLLSFPRPNGPRLPRYKQRSCQRPRMGLRCDILYLRRGLKRRDLPYARLGPGLITQHVVSVGAPRNAMSKSPTQNAPDTRRPAARTGCNRLMNNEKLALAEV